MSQIALNNDLMDLFGPYPRVSTRPEHDYSLESPIPNLDLLTDVKELLPIPAGLIRIIAKQDHDCFSEMILTKNRLMIGRDSSCDFQITSIEISRQHAEIIYKNSHWYIVNKNSTNGIFIDGTIVKKQARLVDNCIVSFGPLFSTTFRYIFVVDYAEYMNLQQNMRFIPGKISPKGDNDVLAVGKSPLDDVSTQRSSIDLLTLGQRRGELEKLEVQKIRLNQEMNCLRDAISELKAQAKSLRSKTELKEKELDEVNESIDLAKKRIEFFKNQNLDLFLQSANPSMELLKNQIFNELSCPICCETIYQPTTFSCKHTFCNHCIQTWTKHRATCPICRKPLFRGTKSLMMDAILNILLEYFLSKEQLEERKKSIESNIEVLENPSFNSPSASYESVEILSPDMSMFGYNTLFVHRMFDDNFFESFTEDELSEPNDEIDGAEPPLRSPMINGSPPTEEDHRRSLNPPENPETGVNPPVLNSGNNFQLRRSRRLQRRNAGSILPRRRRNARDVMWPSVRS